MVNPIARPPTCLAVPRRSTAAAKTTQTRKNVRTASTTTPLPELTPVPSAGTPSLPPDCGSGGQDPLDEQHRERRRAELHDPVPDGEER